jgi:hypothetical protein
LSRQEGNHDKVSEKALCEAASMRMVYEAFGMRPATTEAAIEARRKKSVDAPRAPHPLKGKKKKAPQGKTV